MKCMAGTGGDDITDKGEPKQGHVSDQVQDLVPDEFIAEAQSILVQQTIIRKNQRILQRPSEPESRFPESFDFAKEPEGPCGSDVSHERFPGRPISVVLSANQRMGVVNRIANAC